MIEGIKDTGDVAFCLGDLWNGVAALDCLGNRSGPGVIRSDDGLDVAAPIIHERCEVDARRLDRVRGIEWVVCLRRSRDCVERRWHELHQTLRSRWRHRARVEAGLA